MELMVGGGKATPLGSSGPARTAWPFGLSSQHTAAAASYGKGLYKLRGSGDSSQQFHWEWNSPIPWRNWAFTSQCARS